jgi:heme/copper-type cytochrome/quinol oxidase subunit 2
MGFTVRVVTREEYDAWIEATRPKEEPAATGPMTGVVKEWGIEISAAKHVAGHYAQGMYADLVVVAQP